MGVWNKIKSLGSKGWNASNSAKAQRGWQSFKKSANKYANSPQGRADLMKLRLITGGLSDKIIQDVGMFGDDLVNRPDNMGFNQFVANEVGKFTDLSPKEAKYILDKAKPLGRQIDRGIGNLEKEITKASKKQSKRRGVRRMAN